MPHYFYRSLLVFPFLAFVFGFAIPAEAHSAGAASNDWSTGFNHPFHGWDHLLVMIAVGIWAAQQKGRAGWIIPATFVAAMAGGVALGASGAAMPGVEIIIALSVIVFCGVVLTRSRFGIGTSLGIVGLFAFFHGYAHGLEIPGAASPASFGFGVLAATSILHAIGYAILRASMALVAILRNRMAISQEAIVPARSREAQE